MIEYLHDKEAPLMVRIVMSEVILEAPLAASMRSMMEGATADPKAFKRHSTASIRLLKTIHGAPDPQVSVMPVMLFDG